MKDYIVKEKGDGSVFIVLAKNAKDAINQIWEMNFAWRNKELQEENKRVGFQMNHIYTKSELTVRSIDSLHNDQGRIICL